MTNHHPLHCTIRKYSHHFTIENPTRSILPLIYRLSADYTQHKLVYDKVTKTKRWEADKTFGIYVDRGREFRFHIGQWKEFEKVLKTPAVDETSYEIIEVPVFEPPKVEFKIRPGWNLYPQQVEAKDFAVEGILEGNNCPLLSMPTGTGKGITSMVATSELGYRLAVVVAASDYVKKWVKELQEVLELEPSDIAVIQGSDSLMRATNYPDSGYPIPKVFVISLGTLTNWYKLYEEDRQNPLLEAYACMPYELYEHLGVGTVIYDEVHQHPHAVYRSTTYTHTVATINLSATMLAEDPVLRKVQSMMYPRFRRYDRIKMKKYITAHACAYQIMNFAQSKIQTTEWGQSMYSHNAFERSILKHKTLRGQYLEMIFELAKKAYYEPYVEGDKLGVYVGTKAMAEAVVGYFKKRWPELDIRVYLQENDLKDMLDPDVRATTILSGGTAIDVHNLRVVIMTNNVRSPIQNIQTLGRLREMKHRTENNDVHFYHIYCSTIPKHVEYNADKIELFADRVLEHKKEFLGTLYP